MAFCGKCGNMVPKGSKFCMNCGSSVAPANTSNAAAAPTPAPTPVTVAPEPVSAPVNVAPTPEPVPTPAPVNVAPTPAPVNVAPAPAPVNVSPVPGSSPVPGAVPPAGYTQQPGTPVPPNPYYGQPPQKGKSKLPLIIGIIAAVIVAGLVGFGAYKYISGMTGASAATGTALTQMLDQAGFNRQFGDGGTLDE